MIDDAVVVDDWYVVARAGDLADGEVMPARLLGEELALWRAGGRLMAWGDRCVHRGSRLSLGAVTEAGELVCPYHGWRYGADGACVHIPAQPTVAPPAKACATVFRACEAYGFIWVSLGAPARDVPPFPEWDNDDFRKVIAGPYAFHGNPYRTIENFIDVPHFPFVHPMLNGDPDQPDVFEDYDVITGEDGIRTSPVSVFQPFGDHRGIPVDAKYSYHISRPFTAYFSKDTGEGILFCMMLTLTPLAPDDCLVWLHVAINFGDDLTDAQIIERQDKVFAQDKWIVESQSPAEIPLDLSRELHIRADKLSVAYRRWLSDLGVNWGVAR
jgi:phenylpropionate dioxygenase-like ring-hydroxylating dioxygenase large terminal subunit